MISPTHTTNVPYTIMVGKQNVIIMLVFRNNARIIAIKLHNRNQFFVALQAMGIWLVTNYYPIISACCRRGRAWTVGEGLSARRTRMIAHIQHTQRAYNSKD